MFVMGILDGRLLAVRTGNGNASKKKGWGELTVFCVNGPLALFFQEGKCSRCFFSLPIIPSSFQCEKDIDGALALPGTWCLFSYWELRMRSELRFCNEQSSD